jgi:hypothetical protein
MFITVPDLYCRKSSYTVNAPSTGPLVIISRLIFSTSFSILYALLPEIFKTGALEKHPQKNNIMNIKNLLIIMYMPRKSIS